MYRYYVSFSFQPPNGGLGVASLDVTGECRISKVADLSDVSQQIQAQGYRAVTILAFSLYAQEKPNRSPHPRAGGNRR